MMKTPTFGFKIEADTNNTTLTIPDRFPLVALCLLFLDCVLITMALGHNPRNGGGPDFELPAFVVYGGISALSVLIILCVTNNIRVIRTPRTLSITRFFVGIPQKKEFDLAEIRNLRVYGPVRNDKNSRKFQVLFDYGQNTITLARGVSQPTAKSLAEKLAQNCEPSCHGGDSR